MTYRLSREADEDIVRIYIEGIRMFGPLQADAYHAALGSCFELLAANPRMARERHELSPPVRVHPFKAHLVIYSVVEDGEVLIVRVRHGHEDWATDMA